MTFTQNTVAAQLTEDFAANQLDAIFDTRLNQRLANGWVVEENRDAIADQYERHCLMLKTNHHFAVTLDWIQQEITQALAFIAGNETDKFVRNLYKVRLACDDLTAGAHYHDLTVGEMRGVDALVDLLEAVRQQVIHEVLGGVRKDGAYSIEDARVMTDHLLYFATCGLVGERTENLFYGNDILIHNCVFQRPTTLVNTGDLANDFDAAATANALNALL